MLALYCIDILLPLIDIGGLPLPRHVLSFTWSTIFGLVALMILLPPALARRSSIIGPTAHSLIALILFWAGLELADVAGSGEANLMFVMECLQVVPPLILARLYMQVFDDKEKLISSFVWAAVALVGTHTALLMAAVTEIPLIGVGMAELTGRNNLALLLPVCIWMLALFPVKDWPVFGARYNCVAALALANILLSSARTALLIFVWCVMTGVIMRYGLLRKWFRRTLLPTAALVALVVTHSDGIVSFLNSEGYAFWGAGDDATSVLSRSQINAVLMAKLAAQPLLGLGWMDVATTKAYGYMGHTLYVNALAAYGAVGILAALGLLVIAIAKTCNTRREASIHFLFLWVLISSFSNNLFIYFGLVIALIETAEPFRPTQKTE
jgi:hypothetical protein